MRQAALFLWNWTWQQHLSCNYWFQPCLLSFYSLLTHEFRVVWWYPPPILPCKKEILAIFRNNCQMDIKNATLLAFIFCLCADIEHINMYLPNSRWPHNNFEISLANWLHFRIPLGASKVKPLGLWKTVGFIYFYFRRSDCCFVLGAFSSNREF